MAAIVMEPFLRLLHELNADAVRYVVIGVSGANYYAARSLPPFVTKDRDLFLPPDADNEMRAWDVCVRLGFELWSGQEPLGLPRDRWLAERIVERRMVVTATRLAHIVQSKRNAGREKDVSFLVTHEQALRDLLRRDDE